MQNLSEFHNAVSRAYGKALETGQIIKNVNVVLAFYVFAYLKPLLKQTIANTLEIVLTSP